MIDSALPQLCPQGFLLQDLLGGGYLCSRDKGLPLLPLELHEASLLCVGAQLPGTWVVGVDAASWRNGHVIMT